MTVSFRDPAPRGPALGGPIPAALPSRPTGRAIDRRHDPHRPADHDRPPGPAAHNDPAHTWRLVAPYGLVPTVAVLHHTERTPPSDVNPAKEPTHA